eukprot:scaffold7464_cov136-Isochrysis_galbana.AAC.2
MTSSNAGCARKIPHRRICAWQLAALRVMRPAASATPARRLISRPGAPGTCSRTSVRLGKAKTCGGLSRFGVGAPRRRATGGP